MFGGWEYSGGWAVVYTTRARCRRCGRCYDRERHELLETDTGYRLIDPPPPEPKKRKGK
jgi:hypothetical protein